MTNNQYATNLDLNKKLGNGESINQLSLLEANIPTIL